MTIQCVHLCSKYICIFTLYITKIRNTFSRLPRHHVTEKLISTMFNPMHSRTQSTLSSFCCKSLECPRTELQITLTPFVHVSEKPQKILYFHFRFLRFDITLHVYDDSWMTVENKVYETVKIYWDCAFCGLLKIYRLHIEV